jgi:antitoxin component YwqK of YwqJK toxin-antitoxin module
MSCSIESTSEKSVDVIVEYYENGKVKFKKYPTQNDSTKFHYAEYYESGSISKKGTMQDSIVTGYWEYYFENGNLKQKGNYLIDDSLNTGAYAYTYWMLQYDEKGKLIEENDGWMCSLAWRERESKNLHVCRTGDWEFYHENGSLKAKGKFVKGWSDGIYYEYHDNKQIALKAEYDKGKSIGTWKFYYPNGQLKEIRSYSDSTVLFDSCYLEDGTQTLSNGTGIIFEIDDDEDSTVTEYKNHLKHGKDYTYRKRLDNNNQYEIDSEAHYLHGKLHGKTRHFGNYGKTYRERMSSERNYVNGELHGSSFNFFDGKKTQISYFVQGKEHGITEHYNQNTRKLELVEPWIMGKRHGIRKYYTYSGEPELYQYFFEDDKVGEIHFENGEVTKTTIYEGDTTKFYRL